MNWYMFFPMTICCPKKCKLWGMTILPQLLLSAPPPPPPKKKKGGKLEPENHHVQKGMSSSIHFEVLSICIHIFSLGMQHLSRDSAYGSIYIYTYVAYTNVLIYICMFESQRLVVAQQQTKTSAPLTDAHLTLCSS